MSDGKVEVQADGEALARRAAEWLIERANATTGTFRIALSGGSTPKTMFRMLAADPLIDRMPWDRMAFFWGDERFVAPDHPDSNYHMACQTMLDHVPVRKDQIHRMPTDGDPAGAAQRYQGLLERIYGQHTLDPSRPFFDVVLLGMGDDGHTASLLPGSPALDEKDRWVVEITKGRPEARLTLTYPLLDSAKAVAFLLSGAEKAKPFAAIRAGDRDLPAARIDPVGELFWFVDRAAIG